MKKITFLATSALMIAAVVSLSACKKKGCTDSKALNYNSEAKKDDGSCVMNNAKSSLITVNSGEWSGGVNGYSVTKSTTLITPSIAETGAVLCYYKDGTEYYPLPIAIWYGSWTTNIFYIYSSGSISFYTQDDDALTPPPGTVTFKVVTIEASGLIANPDVDLNNYKEVKEAFNLVD